MLIRQLIDDLYDVVVEPGDAIRSWRQTADNSGLLPGIDFDGQIMPSLHYAQWRIVAPPSLPPELAAPVAAAQALVDQWKEGYSRPFGLTGDQLLVPRPDSEPGAGLVVFLGPQLIAGWIAADFSGARLTPALMQLLVAVLAGMPLRTGGPGDGRSAETRKTQARELRNRLGLATTEEVARVVGAFLLRRVEEAVGRRQRPDNTVFHAHVERFYPAGVQPLVILDRDGSTHRILAMGPVNGRPLIVLHPLILPSISTEDLQDLNRLGLRLYWPLRLGQLAPHDPPSSEEQTIHHAIRSIDLVRNGFCGATATLVSIAAASKVAVAYARTHPERVDMLCLAAACVLRGRPQTTSRRLAKSILHILDSAPWLAEGALRVATRHLLSERRFRRFLTSHFADCAPDSAAIRYELNDVAGGRRMKEALELSLHSIRNDFAFQRDMQWDQVRRLKMPVHILHGTLDSIHPLPLIRELVASLPDVQLHVMPDTGQLLIGRSLRGMFRLLAGLAPPQHGRGTATSAPP